MTNRSFQPTSPLLASLLRRCGCTPSLGGPRMTVQDSGFAEESVNCAALQVTCAVVWLALVLILVAAIVPGNGAAAEERAVAGAERQVLRVGPGQQYALPSQAARAARNGALVEIHSGEYQGDVTIWRQNDLTLRGVGERPHLRAGGRAAERKGIWVIKGDRVTVENMELSGARVPSRDVIVRPTTSCCSGSAPT